MGAIFEGSGSWINYVTYFFMLSHPVSYHGITARPLIYLVIFLVQYLHVRASLTGLLLKFVTRAIIWSKSNVVAKH